MLFRSALFFFSIFIFSVAHAEEKILSYNGSIQIDKSGELLITEEITVNAENNKIRHGIYRDFPTIYFTKTGYSKVGFKVLDIQRDGLKERYSIKSANNGKRIFIGDKNSYVQPGIHTYTITFTTNRQIKFLSDNDELDFNLIGTGWEFPIEKSDFKITLPEGNFTSAEVVTGRFGEREHKATVNILESGEAEVKSVVELQDHEGVTVFLTFPKGIIAESTSFQKILYYLDDHLGLIILFGSLISAILYLMLSLYFYGRDRRTGTVIPKFYPPKDLSPAAVRYISNMSFDPAILTSLIVSACIKGACSMSKEKSFFSSVVTLTKNSPKKELDPYEDLVISNLFSRGDSTQIGVGYNSSLLSSMTELRKTLENNYDGKVFTKHTGFRVVGTLLLIGCISLAFVREVQLVIFFHLIATGILIVLLLITASLFFKFMSQPLDLGRKLLNEIDGFKMYLGTTEKDRFNKLQAPNETLELYEKYLPFAIALGVENIWSEKFNDKIEDALKSGRATPFINSFSSAGFNSYNPIDDVTSSLNSTIASSTTPPSSSSSSSGGSSGGGGGGGGGGGW